MRGRKTSQGNIGHTERRKEKGLDPTSPSEQQQLKIGRYENDIERHRKGYAERVVRRNVLSAMVRAAWGITLCAGGLAVGIAGEILLGMLNFMFGILTALLSVVAAIDGEKTQQDSGTTMQVLRGGQHLRIYGRGVHQRQLFLIQEVVPRVEQGGKKGLHRLYHLGMPAPIPHRDFTENRITILNYRQWKLLTFIWIAR